MSIEINFSWNEASLPLGTNIVNAYCRKGIAPVECDSFVSEHLESVVGAGGVIFRYSCPDHYRIEEVLPGGIRAYRYAMPKVDLWYLPKCSFEESLGLLDFFKFPDASICLAQQDVRQLVKHILRDIANQRIITMVAIEPHAVVIEQIGSGESLATEDVSRVLGFNQQHFGVEYSKAELRDLKSNYRQKRFFVLGKV